MRKHFYFLTLILAVLLSCSSEKLALKEGGFPDFITSNEDYYITRIGDVPKIDAATYRLEVKGLIEHPKTYNLEELYAMEMIELPLTVECIGNSPSGPLVSTAIWKGFRLYALLDSLGIRHGATGVRYQAADGYYASHTLEQVRNNGVRIALYMNGRPLPPLHGFPVRILNPGYFGVKQPAWVTSIEVIDRPMRDYWEDRGWDCSPPMAIDSHIFQPDRTATVKAGKPLRVTGAAFGGTRVAKVELTTDKGKSWVEANIVKKMDADNVWVFWEAELTFSKAGSYTVNARATD
ncbi:MAG TPA: molybdopterin-dependent oxidoreductase, partial [Spirochaetia bacterium]|nr:molybdopterin-dependent oxidoreductase [Spirochaetia bacterium]